VNPQHGFGRKNFRGKGGAALSSRPAPQFSCRTFSCGLPVIFLYNGMRKGMKK